MHRRISGFTGYPADCRASRRSEQLIDQYINSILRRIDVATRHRFLREISDKATQMTLFFRRRPVPVSQIAAQQSRPPHIDRL